MSDPTVSAVTIIQPPAAAAPADPWSDMFTTMRERIIREYPNNPEGVGSARVQTVTLHDQLQQAQQVVTQLTTIAGAFKPATPVGSLPEGLGHAAAMLVRALQGPFVELQQQIIELNRKVDSLEGLHRQFAVDVEGQVKQVEANVAKEMHAVREALKETKELQRAHEQTLLRLANLERQHKLTAQHLQRTQKMLSKLTANVEGWQEHERAVDRHVEEIVVIETHDDGRGPKQRR